LHRSRRHRVLGGVAAGIAETYGIDLLLVRVLWVLAAIAGFGGPVYLVAWLLLPYGDEMDRPATEPERARERRFVIALGLIVIGVFVAFEHAWRGRPHFEAITWPVFLILGGLAILFLRGSSTDDDTEPPLPPVEPARESAPETETADAAASTPAALAVTTAEAAASPEPPTTAWTQTAPWPTTSPRPRRERRVRERPFLTPVTLSVLLIGAGVVALLHEVDAIDVNLTVVLAIGLGIVALALIASAWIGRARGLIFVGLLLAAATGLSSVVDVPLHGGWGERHYHPTSSSLLARNYELAGGQLFLNLRDLPVRGVERVKATLGFGQLDVDVPSDVRVVVRAHAGAGSLQLFGRDDDGIDVSARELAPPTTASQAQRGTIQLDLRVGAGAIRVTRFDRSGNEILSSTEESRRGTAAKPHATGANPTMERAVTP
jgi:phage shock protein PspC (stress-responsive transcriptional regulator)